MWIWLWHCTRGCRAGGGLLRLQEGTEVALAASSAMPVTGGDGGGDGEGDVGDPHWVW